MNAGTVIGHRGARDGNMAVTCWCESSIVHVTADDVLAGRTLACTRRLCRQIGRRMRERVPA